jgi:hypothetical protein
LDDIASHPSQETPFKIIKDVKLGLKDADPNVRVSELTKLRDLQDPEVKQILVQSMADQDLRVKLKAIDILGARAANAAVAAMSSMLFLRSTEQIVKLHLVLRPIRKASSSIGKDAARVVSSEAPVDFAPVAIGAGVPSVGSFAQLSEGGDAVMAQAFARAEARLKLRRI